MRRAAPRHLRRQIRREILQIAERSNRSDWPQWETASPKGRALPKAPGAKTTTPTSDVGGAGGQVRVLHLERPTLLPNKGEPENPALRGEFVNSKGSLFLVTPRCSR